MLLVCFRDKWITYFIFYIMTNQAPPYYTVSIGKYELTLLAEKQTTRDLSTFTHLPDKLTAESAPQAYPSAVNAFLLKTPEDICLFDTGYGDGLLERLRELEVSPKDISKIFITHMHPDHIGGLVSSGSPVFDQAQLIVSQAEYDYWNNSEIEKLTPEAFRPNFKLVQDVFAKYRRKLELIIPSAIHEPFADGVEPVEAYGHTVGHTAYQISSEGHSLLIWGDLVLSADLQLPYPDIATGYDTNAEKAVRNRRRILNYLVQHQVPAAGMHIAYPGIGTVTENPETDGYRFIPFHIK